jgi:hypothetical protein
MVVFSLGGQDKLALELVSGVLLCALVRIDHLKAKLARREQELHTARAPAPVSPDPPPEPIDPAPAVQEIRVVSDLEDTRLILAAEEFRVGRLAMLIEESRWRAASRRAATADITLVEHGGWMVERDVAIGEWRVPFLVLGPSGAYAIQPTDGWEPEDVAIAAEVTEALAATLEGRCHCATVLLLPFSDEPPRGRAGLQERSVITMGRGQLLWMLCAEPPDGLSFEELDVLRAAAAARRLASSPPGV